MTFAVFLLWQSTCSGQHQDSSSTRQNSLTGPSSWCSSKASGSTLWETAQGFYGSTVSFVRLHIVYAGGGTYADACAAYSIGTGPHVLALWNVLFQPKPELDCLVFWFFPLQGHEKKIKIEDLISTPAIWCCQVDTISCILSSFGRVEAWNACEQNCSRALSDWIWASTSLRD